MIPIKSFAAKIWLPILAASVILGVSLYLVLNVYYRNKLLENTQVQYEYDDELLIRNVESYASTANSCLNTIILQLNQALNDSDLSSEGYPSMRTLTQKKIYTCLLNSFSMFHDAEEVALLWDNGVCYYREKGGAHSMYSGETALAEALDDFNISFHGTWINAVLSGVRLYGSGLYCIKPYMEIESGRRIGYVILKMKELGDFTSPGSGDRNLYLFSRDGLLLQTNDESARDQVETFQEYAERLKESLALAEQLSQKGDSRTIYSEMILNNQWRVVTLTSLESAVRTLDRTVRTMFILGAVVLLALFAMIAQNVTRAIQPIRQLSAHMLSAPDELPEVFVTRHSDDETGILIDSYNRMIHTNKELVGQLLKREKREKQLELSLLQAQIKPHFLYNTLDTIYCLNAVGRFQEASTVVKLLSEYYRLALNKGLEQVALTDELDMVRIYLEIQTVRYKKILSFSVTCDPDVPKTDIPRLLLQPLVENAIEHGIKPAGQPGNVSVSVIYRQDAVEIRVRDDGVGFAPDQFEKNTLQERLPENGYGLYNVAERLRLYYGSRCSLELEKVEKGTSILIRIADEN